jgi:diguanylate cyclase (GGDEF)-like protein/PAS domain S-box-containing protein
MRRLEGQKVPVRYEFTAIKRDRSLIKLLGFFSLSVWENRPATLVQVYNLKVQNLMEINNDETKYKEVLNLLNEVVFEMNIQGKITFANNRAYDFFGLTEDDYRMGVYAANYVIPGDRIRLAKNLQQILKGEFLGPSEFTIQRKDGSTFPAMIHTTRMMRNGKPVGWSGIIIDISEHKMLEDQIITLSRRDALTGLYNRLSFEDKMRELADNKDPFSIIICDVDGLKLANDTMGHSCGDQLIVAAAQALKTTFSNDTFIARIGGDEFVIILTHGRTITIEEKINALQVTIAISNRDTTERIPLSLSCGYAVSKTNLTDPERILKEADHNMYKVKLYHSQSNRNTVIQTLLKALNTRDYISEGHIESLQNLMLSLAARLGIAPQKMDDQRLFVQFHDIGKIGVPDWILFKQEPFAMEERTEMQRHSEIGYRIAQAAPDLVHISDWILKHHEWWDGSGYPLGLKGTEIPLECRILSIVDAFDAMTHDRTYRKAIAPSKAIAEIKRFSGVQFDPRIVEEFLQLAREKENVKG